MDSLEETIVEIAKTIKENPDALSKGFQTIMMHLGPYQKDFTVLTENKSHQEILDSLIVAKNTAFIAKSKSLNAIENTAAASQQTFLHATDGSKNVVSNSAFQGLHGSVGMHGITSKGNIRIKDSSIALGEGSAVIFGEQAFLISRNCPNCQFLLKLDRRKLTEQRVRCPQCGKNFEWRIA